METPTTSSSAASSSFSSSSSSSYSSSSSSYTDVDGRPQPLLPSILRLLSLTSTPYSASRLPATITAHSTPITLLKTRKQMLLSKLRARVLSRGTEADWAAVEGFLELLAQQGAPVDRLLTIVSYISETQSKAPTTTAPSATSSAALFSAPSSSSSSSYSSSATPSQSRSPPRSVSALSSRSVQSTPGPQLSAPTSPTPALSAPTTLTSHRTTTAPLPTASSRAMSNLLSTEPSPARGAKLTTPKAEPSKGRTEEKAPERGTERTAPREREEEDEKERRNGWEDDDSPRSSTALSRPLPHSSMDSHQAVDVCYGDEVTLQLPSLLYASLDPDFLPAAPSSSAALNPSSPSAPSVQRLHSLSPYPFLLTLTNAKTPSDRSPIRFLDSISLSADGLFVTLSPHGSLLLSPSPSPSSRFTLYSGKPAAAASALSSLSFLSVRGCVKQGDEVILKASTGLYITDDEAGDLTLVERPTPTSVFTLRRGNLPVPSADIARITAALPPTTLSQPSAPLSTRSVYEQEGLLTADLLYALVGVDGEYVFRPTPSASSSHSGFVLSNDVTDISHRALLTRLLPLCEHHVQLRSYISIHTGYEWGLVQHALVGCVSLLLKEYEMMIASLSSQPHLSLTQLSYHLSSPASTLSHLSTLLTHTAGKVGGVLLNVLHTSLLSSGDPTHRSLLLHLLSISSIPYFSLLSSWLYTGTFDDPHHDFHMQPNTSITSSHLHSAFNDSYWDSRWSVDASNVPLFLSAVSERVLVTGKYLNVIRECGKEGSMKVEERKRLHYSAQERDYAAVVEHAHSFASHALLSLLLTDYALVSHLQSIKAYFLLAEGDWFVHFLDIAHDELCKSMYHIQRNKLQSLLSLALKSSRAAHDPHHDLVTCYLQPHSLVQKIEAIGRVGGAGGVKGTAKTADGAAQHIVSGLDAFTLSYDVTYPLSLLLSRTTLTKYQLLFRLLFNLKITERLLSSLWKRDVHHRLARHHPAWGVAALLYRVRSQMSAFIHALLTHFTLHVLEPRYREMRKGIDAAHSVDEVIAVHGRFVDACLRECMVTDGALLGLLDACVVKCKALARLHERDETEEGMDEYVRKMQDTGYAELVHGCVQGFDDALMRLMRALRDKSVMGYDQAVANLLLRLDFNGFYELSRTLPHAER